MFLKSCEVNGTKIHVYFFWVRIQELYSQLTYIGIAPLDQHWQFFSKKYLRHISSLILAFSPTPLEGQLFGFSSLFVLTAGISVLISSSFISFLTTSFHLKLDLPLYFSVYLHYSLLTVLPWLPYTMFPSHLNQLVFLKNVLYSVIS